MQTSAPDLTEVKSRLKAAWMAGDFGHIANFTAKDAENLIFVSRKAGDIQVRGEYLEVRAIRA